MQRFYRQLLTILLVTTGTLTYGQIRFIVQSLPNATPDQDSIFITGSFNNWRVNDPNYRLTRQLDGSYAITLTPLLGELLEYKFTRGSWMKVETTAENNYLANRLHRYDQPATVHVSIENWQDLGGAKQIPMILFYFFAVAFQALGLLFLASRIARKDPRRFLALVLVNSLLIALFLGTTGHALLGLVWQSILSLSGQLLLMVWGPTVCYTLLVFNGKQPRGTFWWYFVPAFLVIGYSVPKIQNTPSLAFLAESLAPALTMGDALLITFGLVYSGTLLTVIMIRQRVQLAFMYRATSDHFTAWLCGVSLLALAAAIIHLVLIGHGATGHFVTHFYSIPLVFSVFIFLETYTLWRFPELLREPSRVNVEDEEMAQLKQRIIQLMESDRPYRNQDLNITLLSEKLQTKPYILSRVLNEHFAHSFRDFVNQYRIREFIELAQQGKLEVFTYLALAHEVGFNSKSTFNLAFKKFTGQSPRDYFREPESAGVHLADFTK